LTTLLALDPGLDQYGWAVFRTDGPRLLTYQQARTRLVDSGSVASLPSDALPLRLVLLAAGLRTVVAEHGPAWLVVERPQIGGTYARHAAVQRGQGFIGADLGSMHVATGALILTAAELVGPECVALQAAGKVPKGERWDTVYALWPHLNNRGSNADQRDAIWLGLQAVLNLTQPWNAPRRVTA
jgi:hypothetical protein